MKENDHDLDELILSNYSYNKCLYKYKRLLVILYKINHI